MTSKGMVLIVPGFAQRDVACVQIKSHRDRDREGDRTGRAAPRVWKGKLRDSLANAT
jgi:hypothetical protein